MRMAWLCEYGSLRYKWKHYNCIILIGFLRLWEYYIIKTLYLKFS